MLENSIVRYEEEQNNQVYKMQIKTPAFIRLLHAAPGAPNVDIYLNDKIIANNLSYSQFTVYLSIPEGNYRISLYLAGTKDSPILSNTLVLNGDMIMTMAVIGTPSAMEFLAIPDYHENIPIANGMAVLRFVHLSSNSPSLDVTLPDGTIIFQNVSYKEHTLYYAITANNYTFLVKEAGTSTVVLSVPEINLASKTVHTIYVIGLFEDQPQIEPLVLFDGFFI